jgi:hypothetical protein
VLGLESPADRLAGLGPRPRFVMVAWHGTGHCCHAQEDPKPPQGAARPLDLYSGIDLPVLPRRMDLLPRADTGVVRGCGRRSGWSRAKTRCDRGGLAPAPPAARRAVLSWHSWRPGLPRTHPAEMRGMKQVQGSGGRNWGEEPRPEPGQHAASETATVLINSLMTNKRHTHRLTR